MRQMDRAVMLGTLGLELLHSLGSSFVLKSCAEHGTPGLCDREKHPRWEGVVTRLCAKKQPWPDITKFLSSRNVDPAASEPSVFL